MTRRAAAVAAVVLALAAGCARSAERTISDPDRGIRYVVPAGWKSLDAELRSPDGSLLTVRFYPLVHAEKTFVEGLPDTLIPQLTAWTKYYFIFDGEYTRKPTTVAGIPATEFNYPIHVRPHDPPSKVTYWVVKREQRLFVLRAAFAAKGLANDEPAIRGVVERWIFLETPKEGG